MTLHTPEEWSPLFVIKGSMPPRKPNEDEEDGDEEEEDDDEEEDEEGEAAQDRGWPPGL